jgi:tetratricopeptide (TPR) repeat protein
MRTAWWLASLAVVGCTTKAIVPAEEVRAEDLSSAALAAPAAAPPPPTSESSTLYQESYDTEALGKFDDALGALNRLPQPQRDSYVAHLRRGWLLYRLARHADSIGSYAAAIGREPSAIEARVGVLLPLMALKRWPEVETGSQEVIKRDPENYLATLRLAFAMFNLKRYAEAEPLYRKLFVLYPGDLDVRTGLGWTIFKMGKASDAAKVFAEVLEISPKNASALDGWHASAARKGKAR